MVMQSSGAFTRSREQARVRALEAKLNELEEQLGKRFDGTDLFRSRHLKAALVLRSFPWMPLKTNSSPPQRLPIPPPPLLPTLLLLVTCVAYFSFLNFT